MPNRENCTLEELETAARAAPIQRTYTCLMGIKALATGFPPEQVAALFGMDEDCVSRWVRHFNEPEIDGLTDGPRSGRPPRIKGDHAQEYRKLIVHPESVNETHWTRRKFHAYLSAHC